MEIYNQTLLSSQSEMTVRGEVFVFFPLMLFTLDYCLVSIWDNQSIFFSFFHAQSMFTNQREEIKSEILPFLGSRRDAE